jgi:hypothetical protein
METLWEKNERAAPARMKPAPRLYGKGIKIGKRREGAIHKIKEESGGLCGVFFMESSAAMRDPARKNQKGE